MDPRERAFFQALGCREGQVTITRDQTEEIATRVVEELCAEYGPDNANIIVDLIWLTQNIATTELAEVPAAIVENQRRTLLRLDHLRNVYLRQTKLPERSTN